MPDCEELPGEVKIDVFYLDEFLGEVYRLDASKDLGDATDRVYDHIEQLLYEGSFKVCDQILERVDVDRLSTALMREYIHNNPVKRGYVNDPTHWRYSIAGTMRGSSRWLTSQPTGDPGVGDDAERRKRHSHAERGEIRFPVVSSNRRDCRPGDTATVSKNSTPINNFPWSRLSSSPALGRAQRRAIAGVPALRWPGRSTGLPK